MRKFRIYPDSHWVFFDVFIHRSRKAMNKYGNQSPDTAGFCLGWLTGHVPSGRIKPKIGEIHLCRATARIGIVTHEISHAVHRYFSVRKDLQVGYGLIDYKRDGNLVTHREEAFCWVLGNLTRQFCANYHFPRHKKFVPEKQETIRAIQRDAICKSFQ